MEQHKTAELLAATRRLVASGEYAKAFRLIETLQSRRSEEDSDEERAIILSYCGLLTARHLKQWDEGKKMCEDAMQRQFYIAETYVNLARVLLDRPLPPFKRQARKLLNDALKIDGTNRAAMKELEQMDAGQVRPLSFLPADSPVNRFLAKLLGKG